MKNPLDQQVLPATSLRLNPGDFPLGSIESRAAARATLEAKETAEVENSRISDEDFEALVLYRESMWVTTLMSPDYHDIEALPIYQRGREMSEMLFGKIIPIHEDPHYQRSTAASLQFERAFDREPGPGDVLHLNDVLATYARDAADLALFEEVWKERIQNLPCPLHVEYGKVLCRMKPIAAGEEAHWEEHHNNAESRWWRIECETLGEFAGSGPPTGFRPSLYCIEFLGVVEGRHRCRALPNRE